MSEDTNALKPAQCGLCGADDFQILYQRKKSSNPTESIQAQATTDVYDDYGQIVKCRRCTFIYQNPRPNEDTFLDAYINMRDPGYQEEDDSRAINAHRSLHFIKSFKKSGWLLDVGCLTGHILNAARLNFEGTGIEPSKWAAAFARDQMKLNVMQGVFEKINIEKENFDVITMADVIEHFSDPLSALKKAHSLLAKGGILYLITPNIASLSANILGSYWWGLRSAHFVYFTPRTMEEMLQKAGFRLLKMRSYGRIFTYGYWISRLKNYPAFLSKPLMFAIEKMGLGQKMAYINTFDSFELCAIKD